MNQPQITGYRTVYLQHEIQERTNKRRLILITSLIKRMELLWLLQLNTTIKNQTAHLFIASNIIISFT